MDHKIQQSVLSIITDGNFPGNFNFKKAKLIQKAQTMNTTASLCALYLTGEESLKGLPTDVWFMLFCQFYFPIILRQKAHGISFT